MFQYLLEYVLHKAQTMWGRTGFDRDVLGSNCSRLVTVITKTKITDNSYMRAPRAQAYCAA